MSEVANKRGYAAVKAEATKGTAVIPDIFVPLYSDSLVTNMNFDDSDPIVGHKFMRSHLERGMRIHNGSMTVLAEPNSAHAWFDMLLEHSSTTGASDPYTHNFVLGDDPTSYTVDIARGSLVTRYMGVEASRIAPTWEANEMRFEINVTARHSFTVREIVSVTGGGPSVVTLKTSYDPAPNKGLVDTDLVQLYDVSTGSFINGTVTDVDANGTDFTVTEDWSDAAADDMVSLRHQTPSYSLGEAFLWSRTEFRYAASAASALTAAHTPMENGSTFAVLHEMNSEDGEQSSGSFDPSRITRQRGDVELNTTQFFEDQVDLNRFLTNANKACVIRCFSGASHEMRITMNQIAARTGAVPPLSTGDMVMQEIEWAAEYNTSAGQAFDVKVINAVASV